MGLVRKLGSLSDVVTKRLVKSLSRSDSCGLLAEQMGVLRSAQLDAVIATSRPMMLANLANAAALVLVEWYEHALTFPTTIWAFAVASFAFTGWRRANIYQRTEGRRIAGVRAPGKIALSSFVLALLWCYPVVFVLPTGSSTEIAFVSALTAGMVAGGALALYPVPLAGLAYTSVLSLTAFCVIVFNAALPALPFAIVIAAFAYVVFHSVLRHAGMFLSELVQKLNAERQGDITKLLMHAYQGEGGHYLWRCNQNWQLATDPIPLQRMLQIGDEENDVRDLSQLFKCVDAMVITEGGNSPPLSLHLEDLMASNQHFKTKLRLDDDRTIEFAGRPEALTSKYSEGFHGYIKDISGETRYAERIRRLASIDSLTGLLNYREFRTRAEPRYQEGIAEGENLVFLFLDADNLKVVNDSYGHGAGDKMIIEIANRLADYLPKDSFVARKGGDEFVALAKCVSTMRLEDWCKELLESICSTYQDDDLLHAISCCIGVSDTSGTASDLCELELQADRALHMAKSKGKRQFRLYDETIGQNLRRSRILENDLKIALADENLHLELQTVFDANDLSDVGVEALIRWDHPTFGTVPAEEIVSLSRACGLNIDLLEFVLRTLIKEEKFVPGNGFLSVNINPEDLCCPELSDRILNILNSFKLTTSRLWLEITESEVLSNSLEATLNLENLRAKGVKIAIDDFGAGYSSLSRLEKTQADILKIDRSLIKDCDKHKGNTVILNSLCSLAEIHGFQLVAEGVETYEEVQTLRQCSVHMLQGFILARPMPALEYMRKQNQSPNELKARLNC